MNGFDLRFHVGEKYPTRALVDHQSPGPSILGSTRWDALTRCWQEVMMRYETTTKLASNEALAMAERFFAGEFGLAVRTRGPQMIGFEGGGGHVAISVADERPTTLEIETREWDMAVVAFMGKLPR